MKDIPISHQLGRGDPSCPISVSVVDRLALMQPAQHYPEPTVGALIFNPAGRLFLMQSHKWGGRYVVPGGHVELGETLKAALRREVAEETGLTIHDIRFVCTQEFIYDPAFWRPRHFIFFDYACRPDQTEVRPQRRGGGIRLGQRGRGAAPADGPVHRESDSHLSGTAGRSVAMPAYNTPNLQRAGPPANRQTRTARNLLARAAAETHSIAEGCCGDCTAQWESYCAALPGLTFCSLDVAPAIVATNRATGVPCVLGNALDPAVLRPFLAYDVIFFGPPLSAGCDGHHALAFDAVQPGFAAFTDLFLGRLGYAGTLVCIGPKTAHLGDIRRLYDRIRAQPPTSACA